MRLRRHWSMLVGGLLLVALAVGTIVVLGEEGIGIPDGTRQILCIQIMTDPTTAKFDPAVTEACAEVDVYRKDYGPATEDPS